jgi:hypothetical protein
MTLLVGAKVPMFCVCDKSNIFQTFNNFGLTGDSVFQYLPNIFGSEPFSFVCCNLFGTICIPLPSLDSSTTDNRAYDSLPNLCIRNPVLFNCKILTEEQRAKSHFLKCRSIRVASQTFTKCRFT